MNDAQRNRGHGNPGADPPIPQSTALHMDENPNLDVETVEHIFKRMDELHPPTKARYAGSHAVSPLLGARIIDVDIVGGGGDSVIAKTVDGKQLVISAAYRNNDGALELANVIHPIKTERTIEDVLQHCAELRGVGGLSWRTMHEFFWFVAACKWGNRGDFTTEEYEVYIKFGTRPVGLNASFEKMMLDEALLFEEYCENEYGDD